MLQDIEPRVFHNVFQNKQSGPKDLFLAYQGDTVLIREDKDKLWYPSFADFSVSHPHLLQEAQFLFTIDELNYYLVEEEGLDEAPGWIYVSSMRFHAEKKYWRSFAGAIGWQLNRWYGNHRFCSRCRKPLKRSKKERLLYCASCGMTVYPTISPCVIVAVHDRDRLLLTKYANREYRKYALIAGFAEIGESLEQTVRREVMEEVGLRVKNIRYYKSQPWPFTDTLLAGFYAELDGADTIRLDEDELAIGVWLPREEIPEPDNISLTGEMIEAFRRATVSL
ncbi:MAG: NAD(+) diphosphatase [Desulfotomaculaceae bacterium]|nr:NAD(+) diphosphatase [Desulfotomaculaceae bacterium]